MFSFIFILGGQARNDTLEFQIEWVVLGMHGRCEGSVGEVSGSGSDWEGYKGEWE